MTDTTIQRPDRIDIETHPGHPETLPAHDLRALGLGSVAGSLGIVVADLGPLQVTRAQADLVHCPICPGHQVSASRASDLVRG